MYPFPRMPTIRLECRKQRRQGCESALSYVRMVILVSPTLPLQPRRLIIAPAVAGCKRWLGSPCDPQVLAPGPHGLRVLPAHDPSNLNQVIQIMDHPRSEMLAESYSAELGMPAGTVEVSRCQTQGCKSSKTLG